MVDNFRVFGCTLGLLNTFARFWRCFQISPASGSALKISPAFAVLYYRDFLPLATFHQLGCPIPYGLWVFACFCPSVFLAVRTASRVHPAPRKPKQSCVNLRFDPPRQYQLLRCLRQRGCSVPDLIRPQTGGRMRSDIEKATLLNEYFISQCAQSWHMY